MKERINLTSGLVLALILGIILIIASSGISDRQCKKYIISHADDLRRSKQNPFILRIDSLELDYYQDATIRYSDESYSIVFWGNRESFLWKVRRDKYFVMDIPYWKSKNLTTKDDETLIEIFKKVERN